MDIQCFRRLTIGMMLMLVLGLMRPATTPAFEPAENDDIFLGFGSSNIELRESDELLSGSSTFGGIRIGLFWTVFLDLGYGVVNYSDSIQVGTEQYNIDFRTTGGFGGMGFLIPIRKITLGLKATRSVNNRWSEEVTNTDTGASISRISGDIDYNSYFAFTRFGEKGTFELGVRRDQIKHTDSVVSNSFGPYIALNYSLD